MYALVVSGCLLALGLWARLGPLPAGLLDARVAPSVTVVDRRGEVLYEARGGDGTRGAALTPAEVPALLAAATVAAEDVRFRRHPGVDPLAMTRALWRNVRARRIVEGGSTITQQVAELLLRRQGAPPRRRLGAKLREAVMALRLEHRLTKDDILALYLSLAPYGNQITGAARASQAYFGRPVADLTVAEAAYLAALPQQPTRFNPWRRPDAARARQQRIIDEMATRGWITGEAAGVARRERLTVAREDTGTIAPHYVARVLAGLDRTTPGAPARVTTTLDARLQRDVQGIIRANRPTLDAHFAHNVAVAVLDNRTGDWLAWEGSGDYFDQAHGGAIDGVTTPRQPGSALKPFTYAAAFERGAHPGRVLADVPSHFPTAQPGILYQPRNYDGEYRGPLLARFALAGSENVPAVALAHEIGVPTLARLLRDAGLSTLDKNTAHYGLGLTLGNAEVPLAELVQAYALFARGGLALDGRRLVSPRTAFFVTDILSDNDARAFVFGRGGPLEFPFPVAAKTGTSQAYRDNLAIGYTREVTVGVWVGNFDRAALRGSSGVTGAGPIFHEVLWAALERTGASLPGIGRDGSPILAPPPDVRRETLCALSGMRAHEACPSRVTDWVPAEWRGGRCDWHHATDRGLVTVLPAEYHEWEPPSGSARVAATAVVAVASAARTAPAAFGIASPLGGATYLYDPTLRREFQAVPLRARGAEGDVEWRVDGVLIGRAPGVGALDWPLTVGTHRISATDAAGRQAGTTVTVR